ncbi:VOC family protein [Echinicola sp. CAU 1574]|uniref:VOC family protein n=1 Tax=Echinicola arenosa TaxID=2774144 RepID=A0ABR9AGU9_9BACT|nr:VOC family protein [Echinicola arenosa]MBD8488003.1 VOC family protein [Echinicola arenosa]
MKNLLAFLSILLLTSISMSAFSQTKLNHIAVYVEDLKASSDFYGNFLGLTEIEEPFKDGLHTWYDIGGGQLHLIEQLPWTAPTINKINHLCFSMADLDGFIEKLRANNISFEDWPGEKGKVNIRPDGVKQIYIQDPNGYWIEVNDEH